NFINVAVEDVALAAGLVGQVEDAHTDSQTIAEITDSRRRRIAEHAVHVDGESRTRLRERPGVPVPVVGGRAGDDARGGPGRGALWEVHVDPSLIGADPPALRARSADVLLLRN